jgi:hypothetical protein
VNQALNFCAKWREPDIRVNQKVGLPQSRLVTRLTVSWLEFSAERVVDARAVSREDEKEDKEDDAMASTKRAVVLGALPVLFYWQVRLRQRYECTALTGAYSPTRVMAVRGI